MVTWVYDEIGCAGAILDDFCIRDLAGHTVGWVFGLSVFSLKGEHIGWFEDGVFFDIHNNVLGFIPAATGLPAEAPALAPEPPLPAFSKRPHVPALRGRVARPAGRGWSGYCIASYLAQSGVPASGLPYLPHMAGQSRAAGSELQR
ncbi:4-fold beta flower protein [Massilia sp. CF038]|uniref:4-fold beta flower protein n=1 Tax=Massilia sp. CF038 TaxID=1881045 RepID=UPI00091888CB|nr:hypothetical protein [Massilia sp. CF038]SHG98617.1 hypothetical protein SAMN05428948_2188 [Massilia sp. CF038]